MEVSKKPYASSSDASSSTRTTGTFDWLKLIIILFIVLVGVFTRSQRKADPEHDTRVPVFHMNHTLHLLFHDHFGHVQTNAGAGGRSLGGKIGRKYLFHQVRGNPAARIF